MRRLNKNYWRLGWVLLTNGLVILLCLSGPIRTHHERQLLHQLGGVLAEVRRTVLSPIINLGPYAVWFILALWERAKLAGEATPYELSLGKVFLIILAVVIGVDLVFYALAFRPRQTEGGDVGLPAK